MVTDGEVDVNPATLQHKKTKLQVHTLIELLTNPKNIVFEKSLKDFRDSRRPKKLRMLINIQCWRYLDRETLTPTIEYTIITHYPKQKSSKFQIFYFLYQKYQELKFCQTSRESTHHARSNAPGLVDIDQIGKKLAKIEN
mgnify:CR=1 FL=1